VSDNKRFTRRRVLAGAAGTAAVGLAGLSGCATGGGGPSIGRVVVVGGGFGGSTAARYLRLWGGNLDVTLVERNPQFISCPMSNLVVGGFKQVADLTRGYEGLKSLGVKLVQGEVTAIEAAARKVRLADGRELTYDRLILSPGVDFMTEQVGGLALALERGDVTHAWKAGPQTVALRRQLEAMRDGGVFAISIPKAPYRCPPGPYERACVVAAYLKQHKPQSKVLVLDANPEVQSKKALFEKAFQQHYAGMLEYRPNAELREVAGRVAKLEFEDVRADVLNVVPPQRAADIAVKAGLVNINQRWVGVDWLSMESTAAAGIHVLGDATFPGPLMPKSGHMANQHGKVAAAAVIQLLRGEAVNPAPVVMNTCYSFVTARDAIHVASVHQYDATDRVMKTVPGSGGVSEAANQMEGRYALSWAQNTWDDMLGGATDQPGAGQRSG
jgi:sulfite dehydrogenase